MNVRFIVSIIICLAVVFLGMFFFATRESSPVRTPAAVKKVPAVPTVTVSDSVSKKGSIHSITGSVVVATPCVAVTTDAHVDTSKDPNIIEVQITTADSDGVCLQRETTKTFALKVTAPTSATIQTIVNGVATQ